MNRFSRRTPPLLMGLVALALMLSIFPSALHIPLSGPNGASEIAPIPGQGKQSANLSQGSAASSGGVGSGGATVTGGGLPPPSEPLTSAPSAKNCVGNTARQTQDPLSPPCVAGWQGDNGGATWRGITSTRITLVLTGSLGTNGLDYSQGSQPTDDPFDTTARLLTRFFNSRFETYRRVVHVINDVNGSEPSAIQHGAYGSVALNTSINQAKAQHDGLMVFQDFNRIDTFISSSATINGNAPVVWSFEPARQEMVAALAAYVCSGLVGRPASQSTDPLLKTQTRRFGIADPGYARGTELQQALDQRCGLHPPLYAVYDNTSAPQGVAKMKADGVTSVLGNLDDALPAAEKADYHPEWIYDGPSLDTQYNPRRSDPDEFASAFGITPRWRWLPNPQPYWYQAVQAVNPNATPDTWAGSSIYYGLLMAFTAIQRAGPLLTPANVQRGLEGFTAAYQPPFSPHASYAAGDHAFVDDFMIVRWDASGNPPGGQPGTGCLRLPGGGARYTPNADWPTTDVVASDTGPTQACQADEIDQSGGALDQPGTP